MRDWQPIETAPRDGTKIDLWTGYNERIADSMWLNGRGWVFWGTDGFESPGWEKVFPAPTHWMPLPQPPEDAR
ncbi:DUF551 domain-containing protein [Paracoccus ferrooxidans]|nr:DUF551 domain-containing protein [Paracoccus ferrooxidans]